MASYCKKCGMPKAGKCYSCAGARDREREQRSNNAARRRRNSGMHVGRPHVSDSDDRVHVSSTLRNDKGKKVRKDRHHTSLGAIAYGQANYDTRDQKRR